MYKKDAIQYFGSVLKLSQALGVTRSAVYLWKKVVPKATAYRLHVMTEGRLPVVAHLYPKKRKKRAPKPLKPDSARTQGNPPIA
jgi:transcriptional repressor of cell division inhibition gene dicB